jgi:hypothetical protein
MTTTVVAVSNWQFPSLDEFLKTHRLQSHSSRVHYDDTEEPVVEIVTDIPSTPAPV